MRKVTTKHVWRHPLFWPDKSMQKVLTLIPDYPKIMSEEKALFLALKFAAYLDVGGLRGWLQLKLMRKVWR